MSERCISGEGGRASCNILDDSVRPLVVVNVAEDGIRVRNPPVKVSDSHRRLLAAQAERSIVRMPGKRSGVPSARVTSRQRARITELQNYRNRRIREERIRARSNPRIAGVRENARERHPRRARAIASGIPTAWRKPISVFTRFFRRSFRDRNLADGYDGGHIGA